MEWTDQGSARGCSPSDTGQGASVLIVSAVNLTEIPQKQSLMINSYKHEKKKVNLDNIADRSRK